MPSSSTVLMPFALGGFVPAKKASVPGVSRKRSAASVAKRRDVALLAGSNPQIPKGEGDAPVQAYIRAMPGWKREVGRRVDALVVAAVSDVKKAVKWNSPLYGTDALGWFLSVHCFRAFVRLAFFGGASLHPVPPGESKMAGTRYFDVREGDELDEELLLEWIRQAAVLPGWRFGK